MVTHAVSTMSSRSVTAVSLGLLLTLGGSTVAQERAKLQLPAGGSAFAVLAFSPDGLLLATSQTGGGLVIWDVAAGRPRHVLQTRGQTVTQLAFTPDGNTLVAIHTQLGDGFPSAVRRWHVGSGQETSSFLLEGGGANRALSPDGRILVTVQGYPNKTAKVWDLTTRKEIASFNVDSRDVQAAAIVPDGKLVALGGSGGDVKLFELPTGKLRGEFKLDARLERLTFSRDGRLLAALPSTPEIGSRCWHFWDVAAGKEILPTQRYVTGLACFSPDGKVFAVSTNGGVQLWSVPGRARLGRLESRTGKSGGRMLFSPDGRLLAMASGSGTVLLWDVPPFKPGAAEARHRLTTPEIPAAEVTCLAFSPDSKTAAFPRKGHAVTLWDVGTDKEIATLGDPRSEVAAVAFAPDGKTLATTALKEPARLWDVASRQVRARLEGCAAGSRWVAFAPDGKIVATVECDDAIRLWDAAGGKLLAELRGEARQLTVLAFSPDGKTLACAARNGGVALWDVATRKVRARLQGAADPVVSLAWTPDSKTLATANERERGAHGVVLWDAALGQQRRRLEVNGDRHPILHISALHALAFAPDGQTLAVAGRNGWMQLWDVAAGCRLVELQGQTKILSVAFSPDGRLLASGGRHGSVRFWDVPKLKP